MTIVELKKKRVSAISLGCDKNRVDLEKMLYNIKNFGFEVVEDIQNAHILIVNTCAFITPAIKEAIDNILLCVKQKEFLCEKVIVTGCLPNRFSQQLENGLIEGVDAFIQVKDNDKIIDKILSLYDLKEKYEFKNGRLLSNFPHFAYLKISDGCDNGCAYCTIPRIRGRFKSTPMPELLKEAKDLVKKGVKEIILVGQDTTRYGIDLYKQPKFVELIQEISKIKELKWIRLLYCYPEMVDKRLLDEIKYNTKVCKYIDIPLQHVDDKILKDMNRRTSEDDVINLIKNIKQNYPEIAIRSTFILGFPGETKKQFNKLLKFLQEYKLNNVGFFPYCKEEKTKAYFMKNQVCNFVKKARVKKAEKLQERIMHSLNMNKIGSEVDIIIDYFSEDLGVFVARDMQNAPDVDFNILIDSPNVVPGKLYRAKIIDYLSYDFKGEILYEYTK